MLIKLMYAPTSPYVRKVMTVAHELGLADRIDVLPAAASPINREERLGALNPLGKIPAALTPDGTALYDSRVICEYLDAQADGSVFPMKGQARWIALTQQALGDGILDAALLMRYERTARPAEYQWQGWIDAQMRKVQAGLAAIEAQAGSLGEHGATIGTVAIGCALGYLDFRFPELDWRAACPKAAAWFAVFDRHPAMAATRPHEA